MTKKPETKFKERILPMLKQLPFTYVEKIQQKSVRGTLDLILSVNGWYVALELKDEGELEPHQKRAIFRINQSRGYAIETTPHNFCHVLQFLKHLINTPHPRPNVPKEILEHLNQN